MQFAQEDERIFQDKEAIGLIASVVSGDSERLKKAAILARTNPGVERFARTQQADKKTQAAVAAIPFREKMDMKRKYQNANQTRPTSGIEIVAVNPNGYAKKEFYPSKEKLEDLKEEMINESVGYLYGTQPDRTNKSATKILGKTVYGVIRFFKKTQVERGNPVLSNLTKEEFNQLYPKSVVWKR
jgi:hypothetical protein